MIHLNHQHQISTLNVKFNNEAFETYHKCCISEFIGESNIWRIL